MRILKFICLCVGTLVYANPTIASAFKYATTFTCGPKELEGFSNFRNLRERYWYYFFNIAADGEFIVLNDDIQYKSFEETELIQLFHQNGGTFTVSHEDVLGNNVYKFKDISKNPIWIKTLIIDRDTKTYVSRVSVGEKNFKPNFGICFDYIDHGSEPRRPLPNLEVLEL